MCGIAGILRFDDAPAAPERLARMLAHLRHRGPDGEGISTSGRCTLLHTRLSIIDLLGGEQPMHVPRQDAHGALALVFNGEIYNHRELRRHLEKLGHRFYSDHCDTEVLLHGYRQWGAELPKRLHGMFAFAIWDAQARRLFLCRDRTGKKPLYLRWERRGTPTAELQFASLAATMVHGATDMNAAAVDPQMLAMYLRLGYTGETSLVPGVTEIPAAHWVAVEADGSTRQERYWQPPPVSQTSTRLGAADATLEVLREAVNSRLEADVPLGCFLSGGIDSSLIAALAQERLRELKQEPLQTFNVAMPELEYDESGKARAVATFLGARHQTLRADGPGDVLSDLQRLIAVAGEPTGDSSILPTYWLSRATRRHVKVALSGDGGDELFGGYDRYRALSLLQRHRWWLARLPVERWLPAQPHRPRGFRNRLRRLVRSAAHEEPGLQYLRLVELCAPEHLRALAPDLPLEPAMPDWPLDPVEQHAAMRWDLLHYLPFDLLRKVDRAAMAVALEVRCPILDRAVCDLAGHLPPHVLMPKGRPKGLLREVAAPYLPRDIVEQPKRGFAVPIGGWFRTTLRPGLQTWLLDGPLPALGLARPTMETWIAEHAAGRVDHTHRLFALLTLALWQDWRQNPALPIITS